LVTPTDDAAPSLAGKPNVATAAKAQGGQGGRIDLSNGLIDGLVDAGMNGWSQDRVTACGLLANRVRRKTYAPVEHLRSGRLRDIEIGKSNDSGWSILRFRRRMRADRSGPKGAAQGRIEFCANGRVHGRVLLANRVKELTTDIASMAWTTMYCTGPIKVLKHG
jgi:hypothetical protein